MTGFKSHGQEPATDIPRPVCLSWHERKNRPARSNPRSHVRFTLICYPLKPAGAWSAPRNAERNGNILQQGYRRECELCLLSPERLLKRKQAIKTQVHIWALLPCWPVGLWTKSPQLSETSSSRLENKGGDAHLPGCL